MNDYSKSFTYIWSLAGVALLLAVAVYVNTSLHSHVLREAGVVREAEILSARFIDPMHELQNQDLVKSLEGFRNNGALVKMKPPQAIVLLTEKFKVGKARKLIDQSILELKDLRPRAARVPFTSLVNKIADAHKAHKKVLRYIQLLLGVCFLIIVALLLRRITRLYAAVQLASEYLELSEQTSYFSEHDHLENGFDAYDTNANENTNASEWSTENGYSSAAPSIAQEAVVEKPIVEKPIVEKTTVKKTTVKKPKNQVLSLKQRLQDVLDKKIESSGHLATLHSSSIKDEKVPADYLSTIETVFASLVRNAVEHGGRSPQEREHVRKDKTLSVFIGLEESETEYTLIVADDGEGIEGRYMRDHALARKLISPEVAKNLSDDKAARLIFLPGFSTSEAKQNNLNLEQLRELIKEHNGSIGMQNKVGDLCKFIIRLPKRVK